MRGAWDSGWNWQHQALPHFPSALGESSNKSCLSHFITLLARADSGRSEPGPDLASPRSSPLHVRSHQEFARPGVSSGRRVRAKRTGSAAGVHRVFPGSSRLQGARVYLCSAGTGGLSAGCPCLGDLPEGSWRRSPAPGPRWQTPKPGSRTGPAAPHTWFLGITLPPGDLDSLCAPPPLLPPPPLSPSSHSSSLLAPSLLLAAARIEVTQRPPVALRRACDQAVSGAASARRWQGWCLKYPWKLWCHLNEGVEQVLSRRLDQSETPARLTTQPGGGACANYYGRKRSAAASAPQSCRPGGGHAFACVCV